MIILRVHILQLIVLNEERVKKKNRADRQRNFQDGNIPQTIQPLFSHMPPN